MNENLDSLYKEVITLINKLDLKNCKELLVRSLREKKDNPEIIRLIGVVELMMGNHKESLEYFDKAIEVYPENYLAYNNKGVALNKLEKYDEAIHFFKKAISLEQNFEEAYCNIGDSYQMLEMYDEAHHSYDKTIMLNKYYADAYCNKGNTYYKQKMYLEALFFYDEALKINSQNFIFLYTKARTLQALKKFSEAVDLYNKSIKINSKFIESWIGLGSIYYENNKLDLAIQHFKEALKIDSNYFKAHINLAHIYLRLFNFRKGWLHYKYRWMSEKSNSTPLKNDKLSLILKNNKKLFVRGEQGLGDQILFASMFAELRSVVHNITISVDHRLKPIFERSFSNIEFISNNEIIFDENYQEQIQLGDLGSIFRNSIDDFQQSKNPFIFAKRNDAVKLEFKEKYHNKKICGLSWKSIKSISGTEKTIPIESFYPILKRFDFNYINLQFGEIENDLKSVEKFTNKIIHIIPDVDLHNDIEGVLSVMAECDFVITASNSVAHFAGASGKETILLLPYSSGRFWYWHQINGRSLWYPSVKSFTQKEFGNWDAPINEAMNYLEATFG